jgi:D-alanyl-D-alanine carboxypeptidase
VTPFARSLAALVVLLAWTAADHRPAAAGPHVVFDAGTGEVLSEHDAFVPWYPASLTKLMTAYVTFEALRTGEITLDSPVVMTKSAAKEPPSKMGFKPGTAITVDTALKILIVKSANDVAVALAESVGGSEAAFVGRMNDAARRLGMVGTRFTNPNGLPDDGQWTTARDFAVLSRAILVNFPEHRPLFRITALKLGGKVIRTHNHLLERYPGTDGMKTGFICASGFNVVNSATRGRRTLVAVVMGEHTAKQRAETTASLLETAFTTRAGLFAKRTTLDQLRPEASPPARPVSIREEVCGRNRAKGEDADAEVGATGDTEGARSYLVPKFEVMAPVVISLGVPTNPGDAAALAPETSAFAPLPRPNPVRSGAAGDPIGALIGGPDGDAPPIQILGIKGTGD